MRKKNSCMNLMTFGTLAVVALIHFVSPSFCSDVSYGLPETVDAEGLIKNAVFIKCGRNRGTGIAIGEKYILTAAHNLGVYHYYGEKIECAKLTSIKNMYDVPTKYVMTDRQVGDIFDPLYSEAENIQALDVVKAYFHPSTRFELSSDAPKENTLNQTLEQLNTSLKNIQFDAKLHSSFGVRSIMIEVNSEGNIFEKPIRIFGPDLAILECKEPHGLRSLEIASPINERSLLHVIGLNGFIYKNNDSSDVIGGQLRKVREGDKINYTYTFKPAIYAQRFTSLNAYSDEGSLWVNRVFLRVINQRFFMDDQVYPNAPDGFGLFAMGDSGAGAVVIKDGTPYLAGIVRAGNIGPIFVAIQNFLDSLGYLENPPQQGAVDPQLYQIYKEYISALNTQERQNKWYITQTLSDVTYHKGWIESILAESK